MAYTADRTWIAAEVPTAGNFNTHLRDNMKWLSTDKPMCRAYNNANVNHTSTGNWQAISAMNSEWFDNATLHDTSTNPDRITLKTVGKYMVGANVVFAANATGGRGLGCGYNASTSGWICRELNFGVNGLITTDISVSGLFEATAVTDYSSFTAWQNSGGNLAMSRVANTSPEHWAIWMGV